MLEAFAQLEQKRLAVLEKHFQNGVIFEGIDGVIIEDSVQIGAGTKISPNVTLRGNTVIGQNCTLTSGTIIADCEIGDGSTINASQCYQSRVGKEVSVGPFSHLRPNSVLEDHVHVGDFVEIKNSTIGVGTAVAHLTYVGDSDVGRNVNFGCGCVTVNYDGVHKFRCKIGNNAFIGCNTNMIAPVEIGDNTFIAAGSTITDGVPDGDFAIARARQVNKPGLGAVKLKDRKLKW
ncbi:MAG: DapH/DapD/GlmU-related protein [Candidatus Merdivicinus sp.]|jgi:bifunctional UDP-N-acetylglucosamine pyrophosphorylase/glucosamine-1-phosphate N-acetyltransferase